MAMENKLAPPIIESKIAAHTITENPQVNPQSIVVPFLMNRAVGWGQFQELALLVKTVQSSTIVASWRCDKNIVFFKEGKYWATFTTSKSPEEAEQFMMGQTYKVQIAYVNTVGEVGHYSNIGTFKFTKEPELKIEGLKEDGTSVNLTTYTGVYENSDQSERVYSYRFDLYDDSGVQIASSGDLLHNSTKDTSITSSSDSWTLRYALEKEKNYTIVYKVKTVNGLERSSPSYRIYNGKTYDTNIISYCNFVAKANSDEAYVELSLQPNSKNKKEKYISGQFILFRASSEDNYSTWHQITSFLLSSHSVFDPLFICKDYCVSQGVTYSYALQAHNKKGTYSNRWVAQPNQLYIDFEDMFLSDGERQLKIKFNPKVTSFKNTLLESKMDTLGGKYPFFFRNGNVSYKEFPISGLISMQMDENETFMKGIDISQISRESTPSGKINIIDTPFQLTGDTIRREREFKMEVLQWLINGKPKLFRSPTEGSFIVRLMNTSLSPNDTLGRMLHTFSSTAYEIDDYTFDNLRKYNMMVEDYVEKRDLSHKTIHLHDNENYNGIATGLYACVATLHTRPRTSFRYRLKNDPEGWNSMEVGDTGIYVFPPEVLSENELIAIAPPQNRESDGRLYWEEGTVLDYFTYEEVGLMNFSHIDSIEVEDCIETYIGEGKNVVDYIVDPEKIKTSIGMVYSLRVQTRPIIPVTNVKLEGGKYQFWIGGSWKSNTDYSEDVVFRHEKSSTEVDYYDGKTSQKIDKINYDFELYTNEGTIDMSGTKTADAEALNKALGIDLASSDPIRNVNGRLILTRLTDTNDLSLKIGSGLYLELAYQKVTRIYTIETQRPDITYDELKEWCQTVEEDMIIDAI